MQVAHSTLSEATTGTNPAEPCNCAQCTGHASDDHNRERLNDLALVISLLSMLFAVMRRN